MPHSVLLMHTLLAGLSALLFGVLRLARSQSSQAPVSEALQRVRPSDVVLMALLDTMHSLLALDGATQLPGTTQTLLLQATLPATVFLSALALRARYGWAQLAGALLLALAVAALLLTARRHLRERGARRANADAVADAEGGARHPPRRTGGGERQEKELLVMPTAAATDL